MPELIFDIKTPQDWGAQEYSVSFVPSQILNEGESTVIVPEPFYGVVRADGRVTDQRGNKLSLSPTDGWAWMVTIHPPKNVQVLMTEFVLIPDVTGPVYWNSLTRVDRNTLVPIVGNEAITAADIINRAEAAVGVAETAVERIQSASGTILEVFSQELLEQLSQGDYSALTGPAGEDGADGEDGESAYEVALNNGFDGTEAEWLASLVGQAAEGGGTKMWKLDLLSSDGLEYQIVRFGAICLLKVSGYGFDSTNRAKIFIPEGFRADPAKNSSVSFVNLGHAYLIKNGVAQTGVIPFRFSGSYLDPYTVSNRTGGVTDYLVSGTIFYFVNPSIEPSDQYLING